MLSVVYSSYRIDVKANSNMAGFFCLFITALILVAFWQLPIFLQLNVKLLISALLILVMLLQWLLSLSQQTTSILSFTEPNRIVFKSKQIVSGELLPKSQNFTFGFILWFCSSLSKKSTMIVIFNDQLDDVSRRRLSRIVKHIKAPESLA